MMGHFNFKSLAFYGVAISSVLLLFKVVTAYGEGSLKAPTLVEGRYRLSFAQNLPSCLQSVALALTIQQSGIYLNGSLLPAKTNAQTQTSAKEQPSLTGQLNNQQLSLSGTVPGLSICNNPVSQAGVSQRPQDTRLNWVKIQSQVEEKNLAGKMILSGIPETIEFSAQLEEPVQQSENSTNH